MSIQRVFKNARMVQYKVPLSIYITRCAIILFDHAYSESKYQNSRIGITKVEFRVNGQNSKMYEFLPKSVKLKILQVK